MLTFPLYLAVRDQAVASSNKAVIIIFILKRPDCFLAFIFSHNATQFRQSI